MTPVLLLRSPSSDDDKGKPDPYEAHFSSVGIPYTSIPVLETAFTNLQELQWMIETGPGFHGFKGVIFTSGRAVEAWGRAAKSVAETDLAEHLKPVWSSTSFYVVGESTASAIRNLRSSLPSNLLPVDEEILGSDSGTSEALAQFILSRTSPSKKNRVKLLCLTGDKNRDTLATILTDGGVQLDAVQVYETRGSETFAASLETALKAQKNVKSLWITFFAPSAADFAVPILQSQVQLPISMTSSTAASSLSLVKTKSSSKRKKVPEARIAAIGPTTASHLKDVLSLSVAATAAKPTPEELAKAIKDANE